METQWPSPSRPSHSAAASPVAATYILTPQAVPEPLTYVDKSLGRSAASQPPALMATSTAAPRPRLSGRRIAKATRCQWARQCRRRWRRQESVPRSKASGIGLRHQTAAFTPPGGCHSGHFTRLLVCPPIAFGFLASVPGDSGGNFIKPRWQFRDLPSPLSLSLSLIAASPPPSLFFLLSRRTALLHR